MKIILLVLVILGQLYSEDIGENQYTDIRAMIAGGNILEADKKTQQLLNISPGDPTLTLYQTEIWIEQANQLYNQKKLKSAFVLYEKAYKNWNMHPVVRKRYFELKDRKLYDVNTVSNQNQVSIQTTQNSKSSHSKISLEHGVTQQYEKQILSLREKLEEVHYKSTLGLGVVIGLNLAVLLVLLIRGTRD